MSVSSALTWTPILARAGGVIVDRGGVTSHPAKIARERGIPAIVAAGDATAKLSLYDKRRITMSANHLLVCQGEYELAELRPEEIARREQEAEAVTWEKERARLRIGTDEEQLQAGRALAKSGLAVDAEGRQVKDIIAGQPYWFRNPPFAYGQFQYDVYLAAFSRLSAHFGVDTGARLLGGLLCTSVAGMTELGKTLRGRSLTELEAIFAERQQALQRWNAVCAEFDFTEDGLSRLVEAWVGMLFYTHMHFEFNRSIEFLITQAKEAMTQAQRIAFNRYHQALAQFHTHRLLRQSKQIYTRLLRAARRHSHLFKSDQLNLLLQKEAPHLYAQAEDYVDRWCEVERDDIRLPLDMDSLFAQLKNDLDSDGGDESPPFQPVFPRSLQRMDQAKRLAELHAHLAGQHEQQHYLIPRGCHLIREKLLRYGTRLAERGALRVPEELFEKGLAELKSLAHEHPSTKARDFAITAPKGNLQALRDVLRASGVVDASGDWAGGDARVVLIDAGLGGGGNLTRRLQYLQDLQRQARHAGGELVVTLSADGLAALHNADCAPRQLEDAVLLGAVQAAAVVAGKVQPGARLDAERLAAMPRRSAGASLLLAAENRSFTMLEAAEKLNQRLIDAVITGEYSRSQFAE